jgi:hypothetical protein
MALPFEWRKNPIFLGVELAKETIRQVAAGHRTIGLFGGGASIGKTYLTRQNLPTASDQRGSRGQAG